MAFGDGASGVGYAPGVGKMYTWSVGGGYWQWAVGVIRATVG